MTEEYHPDFRDTAAEAFRERAGAFDPFAGVIHLPAPLELYGPKDLASADASSLRRLLTAWHEFVHHLQSVGTSFGAMLYSAAQAKQQFSFAYLAMHATRAEAGVRSLFPLGAFLRSAPPELRDVLERMMRGVAVANARIDADHKVPLEGVNCSAAPHVTVRGRSFAITGRMITEGHARFVQSLEPTRYRHAGATTRALAEAASTLPNSWTYLGAQAYFLASDLPETHRHLHFPVLLDFALGGEVQPLPRTDEEWIATHPGHRFVRAVEMLPRVKGLRFDAELLTTDAGRDATRRFYEDLSDACGFGPFAAVYTVDYDDLLRRIEETREEAERSGPLSSEHDYQRFLAIQLRRDHPLAFALPTLSPEWLNALIERLRPFWAISDHMFGIREDTPFDPQYLESFATIALAYHTFAEQLFAHAAPRRALECHVRRFDVTNVCPHYNVRCSGLIDPEAGWPAVTESPCLFAEAMKPRGLDIAMLDVATRA